jgi:hypothetical protein
MQPPLVFEPLNGLEERILVNTEGPDGGEILFPGKTISAKVITRRLGGVWHAATGAKRGVDEPDFGETGPAE